MDYDGALHQKVKAYQAKHPLADFEEIKKHCFQKEDGNLALFALSPRHLEACAAKTCQLLVEGAYSGVLKAGRHYLSIKKDFSNLDEVLEQFSDPKIHSELVKRAYEEVVASGKYRYEAFAASILQACDIKTDAATHPFWHRMHQLREKSLWKRMRAEFSIFSKVKKMLPSSLIAKIKTFRNRGQGVYS